MLRRGKRSGNDPRDFGSSTAGGRLSRFRPGRTRTEPAERGGALSRFRPRPAAPEDSGRGGCCLWPFMLAMIAGVLGIVRVARGSGHRNAR